MHQPTDAGTGVTDQTAMRCNGVEWGIGGRCHVGVDHRAQARDFEVDQFRCQTDGTERVVDLVGQRGHGGAERSESFEVPKPVPGVLQPFPEHVLAYDLLAPALPAAFHRCKHALMEPCLELS